MAEPNPSSHPAAGLHVLLVDDDPVVLKVLERMLTMCQYTVTSCQSGAHALALLRSGQQQFDLVLSDVSMPGLDGFHLLEVVGLEMDLPVIMISGNGDTETVLRGVTHGAVDFLIKPVRIEELRNMWQHVMRRRVELLPESDEEEEDEEDEEAPAPMRAPPLTAPPPPPPTTAAGGGAGKSRGGGGSKGGSKSKKRKEQAGGEEGSAPKKPRVIWSVEMHQQFVNAVNLLGIDKAVPRKILDIMHVEGLTRENVASHLQKYRLYLRRVAPGGNANGAGS